MMEDVIRQQNMYIYICLVLQLVAMLIVCAVSHQPLNGLLTALEKKGLLRHSERPTTAKVIRVYIVKPIIRLCSKSLL